MFTKLIVNAKTAAHCFVKNRDGVTAIEYAVIAAAMAGILAVAFNGTLGDAITGAFSSVESTISAATTTAGDGNG